ncbi:hypothetical protein [Inquilinus sp. OTU3971]|uniref:hypothetical protein n=1 Tax=Inquilinus sp. OTU3971 TaxID=3043855 RepID=UPI00313C0ACF
MEPHCTAHCRTRDELAIRARIVTEGSDHIGIYAAEHIAVALLLNRAYLLSSGYNHDVEARIVSGRAGSS